MKVKIKNFTATIESFLQHASTAVRTWILPDKDGTIAMISDVDAKVEDAINDGVTTKAPSENAVFDKLALKADLVAGKVPSAQIPEIHFRGLYTSLGALQTAIPTGNNGDYATVDSGSGSSATNYIWDVNEGWVQQAGAGAGVSSFNSRTGGVTSQNGDYNAGQVTNTPAGGISSTTVQAAINELDSEKQAALGFTAENTANKATTFGTIDNVKFPTTKAVDDLITAKRGAVNGLASLDGSGKVPSAQIPETHFRGLYVTLVALQTAIPTGNSGDYATVDSGSGSAAVNYIWDVNEGWVQQSGAGAGVASFNSRTGAVTSQNGDYTGSQVTNVAAGNIAAVTVQAAINELDTEKQAISAKDATGGYAGLTLFKINFKNALNTFTSFFTNSNTAARTYTFKDRNGLIADDTDLASKVDETDFVPLTDGATVTWDTSNGAGAGNGLQSPMAKVTFAGASRTLDMTNLKSGASGLLVIKTGIAGVITLTFPTGSVTDAGSLTTYAFPAGINVFYDLTFWYDGVSGTIKWIIGVSNIDTDVSLAANSDLLVASQKATKTYSDTNLNTAIAYTESVRQNLPWKGYADAATVAALPANTQTGTYQILTANANGAFPSIDGYGSGTKFVIQNEADQKKNGKYDLIQVGNAGLPWILRRSTDMDDTAKFSGAKVPVLFGSTWGGKCLKQDSNNVIVGTTNIVFSEFGAGAATWGGVNGNLPDQTDLLKFLQGSIMYTSQNSI